MLADVPSLFDFRHRPSPNKELPRPEPPSPEHRPRGALRHLPYG